MALHSEVTGKIQAFNGSRAHKSVLELSEGKVTLNKGNMMDHQTAFMLNSARFDGRSICCNSLVLLSKFQIDVLRCRAPSFKPFPLFFKIAWGVF